jgi:purine-binding chemotaxis protein CheW
MLYNVGKLQGVRRSGQLFQAVTTSIKSWAVGGDLTGFVVDGVSEVIRIPASEVQPPPTMMAGSIEQSYLTGVFNHAGQLLIIMDLERMFTAAERDALAEWS